MVKTYNSPLSISIGYTDPRASWIAELSSSQTAENITPTTVKDDSSSNQALSRLTDCNKFECLITKAYAVKLEQSEHAEIHVQ